MQLPKYRYKTNESFLDYEFVSEGPKGRINKVVRYLQVSDTVYNLGFGDLDEDTGDISDTIVTNNRDSLKVLATVASTLYDFFSRYPDVLVLVRGSTPSRTRLYRMGITRNWSEISAGFQVWGYVADKWEPFTFRRSYEAFLVRPKNRNSTGTK